MGDEEKKELTFGEKAVGINFNPGGNESVNRIKALYAEIIDHCNGMIQGNLNPEAIRLYKIAITEAQAAQMWAVKAITWPGALTNKEPEDEKPESEKPENNAKGESNSEAVENKKERNRRIKFS